MEPDNVLNNEEKKEMYVLPAKVRDQLIKENKNMDKILDLNMTHYHGTQPE